MPLQANDNAREPTAEQREILQSKSANLIIQANAGATKTTTLAFKAKALLASSSSDASILFLVFTKAAKDVAKEKLHWVGCSTEQMRKISVLTFDEFSNKVLTNIENKALPHHHVLLKPTPESIAPYVRSAMEELSIRGDNGFVERFLKLNRRLKGSMDLDRSKWNADFIFQDFADNHKIDHELLKLHLRYEKRRYDSECDGFDRPVFRANFDATYDLARLLADPEERTPIHEISGWPRQLSALLVDEMHDTNFAMFTIIASLLKSTPAQFCGVGDPDQVVFSSYGAQVTYLTGMNNYAGRTIDTLPLTVSRRFGSQLAQFASQLANNKPYACLKELDTSVVITNYAHDSQGNQLLVACIKAWRAQARNYDVSGIAILLRHSWQSVAVESALIDADIYYDIRGFESFLKQPEVLLIRALHALATGNEKILGDRDLRSRMVESLTFFFGVELPHHESELESHDEKMSIAVNHAVEDGNMRLFVENILLDRCSADIRRRVTNAMTVFSQKILEMNDFQTIIENLEIKQWVQEVFIEEQRKIDVLKYFDALKNAILKYKSFDDYFSQLCNYEDRRASKSKTKILTIALASEIKGFEFDNVLIPYLEDGIFPFDTGEGRQEEKNLLYVAATRAKKNLCLLVNENKPSRFLRPRNT